MLQVIVYPRGSRFQILHYQGTRSRKPIIIMVIKPYSLFFWYLELPGIGVYFGDLRIYRNPLQGNTRSLRFLVRESVSSSGYLDPLGVATSSETVSRQEAGGVQFWKGHYPCGFG